MSAPSAPVIGIVGDDVPRQLVLGAGAHPRRILGSWTGEVDPTASELLGASDAVAARILAELRRPGEPAGIVVCNDREAHLRIFYALRAAGAPVPVHLLDLPRADSRPARAFAVGALTDLVRFCESLSGMRTTAGTLARAAAEERLLGVALDGMRRRRRASVPLCSGSAALTAYRVALTMPVAEAIAAVEDANDPASGLRLHVTGSSHPDAAVYERLERAGCVVVSEDHDTGDAAWLGVAAAGDTVDAVIAGLVDAHVARVSGSPTASAAVRAAYTREVAVAGAADAAVALVRIGDEAPLWDLQDQRDALRADGIPLHVRTRVGPRDADVAAAELVRTLGEGGSVA